MAYTIAANPDYNSIEITFDGKPAEAVREALKALRFRWHKIKKVWYGYTDENTARAAIDAAEQNSDGAAGAAAATTEQATEKKPLPVRDPAALEQYRAVLERVYPGYKKMQTFCVSKCAEIVTLPGGDFITIEKRPIEKDFCFGYSDSPYNTEDYDRAQRMAHHAATHEEYFINENMEYYRDKLDALRGEGKHDRASWAYMIPLLRTSYINQPENSPLKTLELARLAVVLDALGGSGDLEAIKGTTIRIQGHPYRVCTDEERQLIIAGYERVANAHEKRIKAYLKRYGLTKVRTWSYWRDE